MVSILRPRFSAKQSSATPIILSSFLFVCPVPHFPFSGMVCKCSECSSPQTENPPEHLNLHRVDWVCTCRSCDQLNVFHFSIPSAFFCVLLLPPELRLRGTAGFAENPQQSPGDSPSRLISFACHSISLALILGILKVR